MTDPTPAGIAAAVAALRRGECIGLPTETVYGLAADAGNAHAVARIFALKGRPADHPLIVHLPGTAWLDRYARSVPATARELAARYWPGPLTLILPRAASVGDAVTGGQDSVGLRVPAHPVALAVLQAFDGGLAAPSANRFGHVSPTLAAHVRSEFGGAVPIVLDGGPCQVGIESTIVDFSGAAPRILRPGMLGRAAIEAVTGPLSGDRQSLPRASGLLDKHYAPRTPMRLLPRAQLSCDGSALALALGELPAGCRGLALPADPAGYATGLYAALRELDQRDGSRLEVELPPDDEAWLAVHDRLRRAAAGAGGNA